MQQITHDAPDCITAKHHGAKDHWLLMDASELPAVADSVSGRWRISDKWHGGNFDDHIKKARQGDLSTVAKSDELLTEMAQYMPHAARRGYIMDVAGAVPSVPVFLSGNPLNMRRRIKTRDEYAPIAIVYDPTCSAGISHDIITRRGLTVLALVRALAGLRPIELHVAVGLGGTGTGNFMAVRIETAPLDLARAAWMLTSTGMVRGLGYNILHDKLKSAGGWPYGGGAVSATDFRQVVLKAMPHVSDVLAIPGLIILDEMVNDPKAWLNRTFRELTGQEAEAA